MLALVAAAHAAHAVPADSTGAAAPDTLRAEAAAPPGTAPGAADSLPSAPPEPDVLRACQRLRVTDLLRVQGPFGRFEGRAGRIGPDALAELRARPGGRSSATPARLTWDQIDRVDVRANHWKAGAIVGGAAAGGAGIALGALVGMLSNLFGSEANDSHTLALMLGYGAVGAGAGALVGAGAGALVPAWRTVYRRPARSAGE